MGFGTPSPDLKDDCGRLAAILEDETDSVHARDLFWHQARKKLGKLRRLGQSDIWQIEILISARIPKPVLVLLPETIASTEAGSTG